MIVDSSAMLAILLDEPDRSEFEVALAGSTDETLMSGFNYWEVEARLASLGALDLVPVFAQLLDRAEIRVAGIDFDQVKLTTDAFVRFGKGRHPARLNMGDCFAYALAKARGDRLLFKGGDFSQTDVGRVL